jgi:hypothetical protein
MRSSDRLVLVVPFAVIDRRLLDPLVFEGSMFTGVIASKTLNQAELAHTSRTVTSSPVRGESESGLAIGTTKPLILRLPMVCDSMPK